MTVTAAKTLNDVKEFRHQARMIRDTVGANVAGLTHEESLIQPAPGGNCLNWVMGHLLNIYTSALALLGQEPVMEEAALERYARGSDPLGNPAEALEFGELVAAWNETTQRIDRGLKDLTAEALDRPIPDSPVGNPDETVRSLLTTIFFHQAYHAGQTALLRRLAGKEGAIR